MKKLLAVLSLATITTACAYPLQPAPPGSGYPGRAAMYGPPMAPPPYQPTVLPIGRWDNVMMLAAGTAVQVLRTDGGIATGHVVGADSTSLRLRVASGEVELASGDVMRIDRVGGVSSAVSDGAKGAALGAGAVGVLGLIAGHVPPARLFAAGAIAGGYQNVELGIASRRAATIYLAPAVAPARPAGAQLNARGGIPR
jgi:hypothetical protein